MPISECATHIGPRSRDNSWKIVGETPKRKLTAPLHFKIGDPVLVLSFTCPTLEDYLSNVRWVSSYQGIVTQKHSQEDMHVVRISTGQEYWFDNCHIYKPT